MGKKRKRLRAPGARETARIQFPDNPNFNEYKPTFSFQKNNYGKDNCISHCEQADKSAILVKLLRLGRMKWKEILAMPRENGFEEIPRHQFIVTIPPGVTEEVDKLMVCRYSEAGRIAGHRERDIFHVVLAGNRLYRH